MVGPVEVSPNSMVALVMVLVADQVTMPTVLIAVLMS
jgi:hypothetical protein